jgi:UDP-N-acetylmuramoyl-L-alanyl-D-glutamate--2,6-diaminopimelate ligase
MKIKDILKGIDYEIIKGSIDKCVDDITYDSRNANENNLFVALPGIDTDGHNYIKNVIDNGCKVAIVSKDVDYDGITLIKVKDTRLALPYLSANLFGHPDNKLIKIGITGTKGKTSISYMIHKILSNAGKKVGVIGTNGTLINGIMYEHKNTTPESYYIQKYMKMMVDAGVNYLVMEVSSQALKVGRVDNIFFDYAIFTNISSDHVGPREHPTFDDYVESKARLFKKSKCNILNIDDAYYQRMFNENVKTYTYGKNGDLKITNIEYVNENHKMGMSFDTKGLVEDKFFLSVPGVFAIYNACAAILLSHLLGISNSIIVNSLKDITIDGRTEIINVDNRYKMVIDFAHNKLSIESIISSMKYFNPSRIITIFGVGGGRSRDLRKEIGATVAKYSDFCIVTMDNPRNDDIDIINGDIVEGIEKYHNNYKVIVNREDAIKFAMDNAHDNDIILLIGKGHEHFQEVSGKISYFNEREIIEKYGNIK